MTTTAPPLVADRPSARGALAWLAAKARRGVPGRPTAAVRAVVRRAIAPAARLAWRPTVTGLERIPRDGAFLLVANHSGAGVAETLCLAAIWQRELGERPLTALGHPLVFHIPGLAAFARGFGGLPATYEDGLAALRAGIPILIFPGGDHEAFRPIWEAGTVDFAGRQGFLRLARAANVPIVPLGITGAHYTLPILWRSRLLPRLLVLPRLIGVKRLPVTLPWVSGLAAIVATTWPLPPLTLGLAAAWTCWLPAHFTPVVPWPITFRVGEPLAPDDLFGGAPHGPLDDAYARVVAAVQGLVDR